MHKKHRYAGPTKLWGWKFWQKKDNSSAEETGECPECGQGNDCHTQNCVRFN